MIYLFCGEDSFESFLAANKKAKELARQTESEDQTGTGLGDVQIKKIDADELESPELLLTELQGIGMFSSSNVVLAKRLFSNKLLVNWLTENFESVNNSDFVIWHDRKADGKTKLVKLIKSEGEFKNFDLPKEGAVISWLKGIFKAENISIDHSALRFIVEHLGTNRWIILNEFRKIQAYLKFVDKDTISTKELNEVLGFDVKGDIWKFLDSLGNSKNEDALKEMNKLMLFENNSQYLIAMIEREINLMLKVKSAEDSGNFKSLGIHPFVLRKTITKAEKYNWGELKAKLFRLLKLDSNIKSGFVNDKLGLMEFVLAW